MRAIVLLLVTPCAVIHSSSDRGGRRGRQSSALLQFAAISYWVRIQTMHDPYLHTEHPVSLRDWVRITAFSRTADPAAPVAAVSAVCAVLFGRADDVVMALCELALALARAPCAGVWFPLLARSCRSSCMLRAYLILP